MTSIIDILKTLILGIIQGITEWLPVSSTGHMILFNELWPLQPEAFFDVFKVVIQFGSILAVLVLYFNKLNPWSSKKSEAKKKQTYDLWIKVIIGCIPAGVVGLLLDDIVDKYLSAPFVIAATLIAYGVVFIVVSKNPRKPRITTLDQLTYKDALKIGCFQCLALIPGTSRSGATILGGMYEGASRYVASEFSFFIAIPIMAAASLLKVVKFMIKGYAFSFFQVFLLLLGTLVAFVVSLIAIRTLLNYVRNHTFEVFGWYRIVLGIIVLIAFYIF
ncbi:MAG: undecaprenyl-diphosphate phosphatase [Ileibacterium sp.]|nr:undecaprenyl-diphosphate phosphatase [Ileibacterium sp.]